MVLAYLILIAASANLILGIILKAKARSAIQKAFVYIVFFIAFWDVINFIYFLNPVYPFVNYSYAVGALLVAAICTWAIKFSKITLPRYLLIILWFVTLAVSTLVLIPDRVIIIGDAVKSFAFDVEVGPHFLYFAVPVTLQLLFIALVLFQTWRIRTGIDKQQSAYVLLGFSIPALLIVVIDFLLPIISINQLAHLDMMTTLIFAGLISYAIFRYRFFDIRVVIREGFVHFINLVLVLALYVYVLLLSRDYITETYNLPEQTVTILFVLLVAVTFEPLRRVILTMIHSIFVSREKSAKVAVERMRLLLSSTVQFDTLTQKLLSSLQSFFQVKRANFMYRDPNTKDMIAIDPSAPQLSMQGTTYAYLVHRPDILITDEMQYRLEEMVGDERDQLKKIQVELQQAGVGMVVPIGEPGELFGLFVFGQKETSEAFTEDNIRYIKALQPQLTGAIANALMYKMAMERIGKK